MGINKICVILVTFISANIRKMFEGTQLEILKVYTYVVVFLHNKSNQTRGSLAKKKK